jgi:ribosome biogenesis protein SSF1/2
VAVSEEEKLKIPRSMVLKMGDNKRQVGNSLAQLVRDFRQIMQPHTAARLKERKSNKLKDFVVMAGPLGVSHLMIFSQSLNGNTSLRIAKSPRGPTLHFQVRNYSLCKDVTRFSKTPRTATAQECDTPPLLVMNGFSSEKSSDKDALMTSMLQNMFPPISVQTTKVGTIRRVMMINKDDEGFIDIRHYAIDTKPVNVSKPVKKLSNVRTHLGKKLPNMSGAVDIADYVLDPTAGGYTSESEVEDDATVDVSQESSKPQEEVHNTQKRAIKLVELGPRLRLELRKIEEGLCEGKTLYHSYIAKTPSEIKQLEKRHNEMEALRAKRRKEQEENVRRKQEAKAAKSSRTKRGLENAMKQTSDDGDENVDDQMDLDVDPEEMDDYELELADAEQGSEQDSEPESD